MTLKTLFGWTYGDVFDVFQAAGDGDDHLAVPGAGEEGYGVLTCLEKSHVPGGS